LDAKFLKGINAELAEGGGVHYIKSENSFY
jgi:hypothetical protein